MACLGPNAMFSTGEHSASMCTHRDSGFSSPSLQQLGSKSVKTSSQASCYASLKLRLTDSLTHLLTRVKCRATSVAKNLSCGEI